jgi:SNF2 family DNA or RNA helicase
MISKKSVEDFINEEKFNWSFIKTLKRETIEEGIKDIIGEVAFKTTPMNHQIACTFIGISEPSFLFLLMMGTGKTKLILDILSLRNDWKKCLIIVPNITSIYGWIDQIKEHSNFTYTDLSGKEVEREDKLRKESQIYLLNYTGLQIHLTNDTKGKWIPNEKAIKSFARQFDAIVFDEIHYIKNPQSLTYKLANKLTNFIPLRWGLTGTPVARSPIDLWSLFHVIDKGETLGQNLGMFREAYFTSKENYWGGMDYKFNPELEESLNKRIKAKSIHYTLEECVDIPEKVYRRIPLYFPSYNYQMYKEVLSGIISANGDITLIKNAFTRLRMLASGFINFLNEDNEEVYIEFEENPKITALLELIDSTDSKIVVINDFIKSGDIISKELNKNKIKHTRLYSGTKDKVGSVNKFLTDPKCKVFLANAQSAGVSLNLQISNYLIYYETPISPIIRAQSEERIHRTGQTKTSFIFDLVVINSIEAKLLEYLKEGKELYEALIKGTETWE